MADYLSKAAAMSIEVVVVRARDLSRLSQQSCAPGSQGICGGVHTEQVSARAECALRRGPHRGHRYDNATGFVQWMLNNDAPSNIWRVTRVFL